MSEMPGTMGSPNLRSKLSSKQTVRAFDLATLLATRLPVKLLARAGLEGDTTLRANEAPANPVMGATRPREQAVAMAAMLQTLSSSRR